jgi:hypothetical protein
MFTIDGDRYRAEKMQAAVAERCPECHWITAREAAFMGLPALASEHSDSCSRRIGFRNPDSVNCQVPRFKRATMSKGPG